MSATPSAPAAGRSYTCNWCGAVSDGTSLSCPSCGATVNVKEIVTPTGWIEMPGRKDMAKLQIGKSSCQIEGLYVPVADFNLSPEDGVYFAHHVLLWKENSVAISMMSMKGAWKRAFAGMPIFMTQAKGPGHIAFSAIFRVSYWLCPFNPDKLWMCANTSCWSPPIKWIMAGRIAISGSLRAFSTETKRSTKLIIRSECFWIASPRRRCRGCYCFTHPAMYSSVSSRRGNPS